jgi:hypothetical protein
LGNRDWLTLEHKPHVYTRLTLVQTGNLAQNATRMTRHEGATFVIGTIGLGDKTRIDQVGHAYAPGKRHTGG